MFLLGHIGITLGVSCAATAVVGAVADRLKASESQHRSESIALKGTRTAIPTAAKQKSLAELTGLKTLAQFLDIRVLMIGSILPDIVDKPLAYFGFGDGRSITHTLLVFLLVLMTAYYLYLNHRKTWLLAVAIGMFFHLVLDSMWASPHTLLWPFYGWGFAQPVHELGLAQISVWWHTLSVDPWVDISEGIGLAFIVVFVWVLAGRKRIGTFLLKGKI